MYLGEVGFSNDRSARREKCESTATRVEVSHAFPHAAASSARSRGGRVRLHVLAAGRSSSIIVVVVVIDEDAEGERTHTERGGAMRDQGGGGRGEGGDARSKLVHPGEPERRARHATTCCEESISERTGG